MKDKNGVELKHGDFVRVDFVRINSPICTCYCQVYNDKLEVVKGKEPEYYYSRTLTKIGETLEKPLEDVVQVKYTGIKCDNEECGWEDKTVTDDQYQNYIDKPCPCCGENLLTREAYENVMRMKAFVMQANEWIKENVPQEKIDEVRERSQDISVTFPTKIDGTADFGNVETDEEIER